MLLQVQVESSATSMHTLVLTDKGKVTPLAAILPWFKQDNHMGFRQVLGWGRNDYGQLGVGEPSLPPGVDDDQLPPHVMSPQPVIPIKTRYGKSFHQVQLT